MSVSLGDRQNSPSCTFTPSLGAALTNKLKSAPGNVSRSVEIGRLLQEIALPVRMYDVDTYLSSLVFGSDVPQAGGRKKEVSDDRVRAHGYALG